MIHNWATSNFALKGDIIPQSISGNVGPSYSLEDICDIMFDVTIQNMTFRESLSFQETLKIFKEAEEAKVNKELKRKVVNLLIKIIEHP